MYSVFWRRVNEVLEASFFGRIFLLVIRTIGGAFRQSWFYRFFTEKNMADVAENSFFAPGLHFCGICTLRAKNDMI